MLYPHFPSQKRKRPKFSSFSHLCPLFENFPRSVFFWFCTPNISEHPAGCRSVESRRSGIHWRILDTKDPKDCGRWIGPWLGAPGDWWLEMTGRGQLFFEVSNVAEFGRDFWKVLFFRFDSTSLMKHRETIWIFWMFKWRSHGSALYKY